MNAPTASLGHAEPRSGTPAPERAIRLFISSTFRDMQAEREELLKRVLPQIRKLCAQRGVSWGEVDLRWGITEEQAQRGEVLPVCLGEIDRCRPFFLCLLGERYGWVPGPERIPAELRVKYPWLNEHLYDSVTEMEIWHAVLNQPGQPVHAFFYFRDPAYLDHLPEGTRREDYICENDKARQKMAALKDRIRRSGQPVCDPYPDTAHLGERVRADLTSLIDRLFPPGSEPDPLDREASEHNAFARSRLGVYIGRPEYFQRLDTFAQTPSSQTADAGQGVGLVVLGESGSGKSALLANWLASYGAAHPDEVVLYHAIGATPQSADGSAMLRRLLGEFRRRLSVQVEVPSSPVELQQTFAGALYQAGARAKVVLVLDALNQLEDRAGMPDLLWLPPVLPANVRLIVSTLPGRSLEELRRRCWPVLEVRPLESAERTRLIVESLRQASKALSEERVQRIASAEQAANPLFLRALLEELRVFGVHEKLDERITYYLDSPGLDDLFARILERYEADYERDRPGLVREAMTLLWAAWRGLAEDELLQMLGGGPDGGPLPQAYWSPLYLAAEHALMNRGGLIGFFHDYLRRAVERRYLPDQEQQRAAHWRLVNSFPVESVERAVDELPWHLAQAEAWDKLYGLLTDLDFFQVAWEINQFEIKAYWAQVEAQSPQRMVEGYKPVLDDPESHVEHLWAVSQLLHETGHLAEALLLNQFQEKQYRRAGNLDGLQVSLGNQAVILQLRGELDGAMALFKEQERLSRELGNLDCLQGSLGNQAEGLRTRGDLDGAMALLQEQERLCRQLRNLAGLQMSLGNQGLILFMRGDLDGAMTILKEQEHLCRQLGNLDGLLGSMSRQAPILRTRGDLDGAMILWQEQERLCRQLGSLDGLQASLGGQALVLTERGELDGAMPLLKEQERLCRQLGNPNFLQVSLGNQALILKARGDLDGALALLQENERLSRQLGNLDSLQLTLGNEAVILLARGNPEGAMPMLKEQERLCRQLGNLDNLQMSLGNQALILNARGDLDGALALHKEEDRLCRQVGNLDGLQISVANQAVILQARGDLDGALTLWQEQERLCRQLGKLDLVQTSLGRQALILRAQGDVGRAMSLLKEQEHLCRQIGHLDGLQGSLGNQAPLLAAGGDQDGAMALWKEQERLCRQLGNLDGFQISLANQAVILQRRGDLDGAMTLFEEQEHFCRQFDNLDGVQGALGNRARILGAKGNLDGAMALGKEQERLCRQIGNLDGLQASLGTQGAILRTRGDLDGAMALHQEQERLCRQLGHRNALQASLGNQASILKARGDPDGALTLYQEQERLCRECANPEGLASSLVQQAGLHAGRRGQLQTALSLLDEALRFATQHGLTVLVPVIRSLQQRLNKAAQGTRSEIGPAITQPGRQAPPPIGRSLWNWLRRLFGQRD